ncbi:hypothetical protein PENTCL1PPCAC_7322, partial [Pristionchus entomophagus]
LSWVLVSLFPPPSSLHHLSSLLLTMDNGDSRHDERPAQKKRKVNSSETGQSSSIESSGRQKLNEMEESDVEIVYDGAREKEKETRKKSKDSEKKSSEAEKVKTVTQQLEESILREKELSDQLAIAKGIEESLKKDRDDTKRMYHKCLVWTRHFELRAVYAETTLTNFDEAKVAKDPQLRKENIKLYKRLGELDSENVQLKEKIAKGNLQSEPNDDKLEKLMEELEMLRKEKEEWKEEEDRKKKKEEKEECDRMKEMDELKTELKRIKKKKDSYADDADYWEREAKLHKEEKKKILSDLDDAKSDVRILRKNKEKWRDDWEEEKKESTKLEKKVKELENRLKKEEEKHEEMKKKLDSIAAMKRCDGSTQTEKVECEEETKSEELSQNQSKELKKEENGEISENIGSGDSTVTSLPAISSSTLGPPSVISIASRLPSVLRDVDVVHSDEDTEMDKARKDSEKWSHLLAIELNRTEELESELKKAETKIKELDEHKMNAEKKLEKFDGSSQTEKVGCEEVKELKKQMGEMTVSLREASKKIDMLNAERDKLAGENKVLRPIADHWQNYINGEQQQQLQPSRLSLPYQHFVQQPQQHPQQLMQQGQQAGPAFPQHLPQRQEGFMNHLQQHPQSLWQQSPFMQQARQPQQQHHHQSPYSVSPPRPPSSQ